MFHEAIAPAVASLLLLLGAGCTCSASPHDGGYFVSTLAGNGDAGLQDGPFAEATFQGPFGLVLDQANQVLYVADRTAIRKVDLGAKTVSTLAGGPEPGFSDGKGAAAAFVWAAGMALSTADFAVLIVSDGTSSGLGEAFGDDGGILPPSQRIRQVGFDGTVTTIAGNGDAGYQDGLGPSAEFDAPEGVWADAAGAVYVADLLNYRIRKIDPSGVSTFAGSGPTATQADLSAFWDAPSHTVADGLLSTATFARPQCIVGDGQGYFWIGDGTVLRAIDIGGNLTTYAGIPNHPGYADSQDPLQAFFDNFQALALLPDHSLAVGDSNVLRRIEIAPDQGSTGEQVSESVTTLAGQGIGQAGFTDGPAAQAVFADIEGLAVDTSSGAIYVSDEGNHRIRLLAPQ